jgi:hypothetical protein
MLEKQLIGFINSLTDILDSLRTNQLPKWITLSELGNMFLKSRTVQVLSPHSVISPVECNRMIIDNSCSVN